MNEIELAQVVLAMKRLLTIMERKLCVVKNVQIRFKRVEYRLHKVTKTIESLTARSFHTIFYVTNPKIKALSVDLMSEGF